ncbi:hypothetical protein BH09SUM1_BH09SUM1_31690 [soil metagenome]
MAEPLKKSQNEDLQIYPTVIGVGSILINPDVIARIAGLAVNEIEGVSLGTKFSLADILPTKEPVRGIQVVKSEGGRYSLIAEVKMAYGTPMWETAEKLQRHIKDTVERMTNLELETVDIKIVDIFIDKKDGEVARESSTMVATPARRRIAEAP